MRAAASGLQSSWPNLFWVNGIAGIIASELNNRIRIVASMHIEEEDIIPKIKFLSYSCIAICPVGTTFIGFKLAV